METSVAITFAYSIGMLRQMNKINFSMVRKNFNLICTFKGIPLTKSGTVYFLIFNYLCLMSLISHWRAAWADPGSVPKRKDAPALLEVERAKFCRKCDMNWKPERAHHCSECKTCVYKVYF
jgi:hypothetical protein